MADAFNNVNAVVYGISVDTPFSQKAWADQNNLNFTLLSDFNRSAVNAYGVALPNLAGIEGYVASQRAVFIVDGEGVIRYKWGRRVPPQRARLRRGAASRRGVGLVRKASPNSLPLRGRDGIIGRTRGFNGSRQQ